MGGYLALQAFRPRVMRHMHWCTLRCVTSFMRAVYLVLVCVLVVHPAQEDCHVAATKVETAHYLRVTQTRNTKLPHFKPALSRDVPMCGAVCTSVHLCVHVCVCVCVTYLW